MKISLSLRSEDARGNPRCRASPDTAISLLKHPFAGHSERSAAAGEGGAARSRGTPWKVRSAREADKHRLLRPCRTRLTRDPSTSLRPLCRLRSAANEPAGLFEHDD